MCPSTPSSANHRPVYPVLLTIIIWTLYVLLMKINPTPFAQGDLRAIVRVVVVLLPALRYVAYQQQPLLEALQLQENWCRGILVGGGIAISYLFVMLVLDPRSIVTKMPVGFSTWFNYIIGSPLAEEVLFRGVLFQHLSQRMSVWRAALISTAAFTLLHIPVWLLLNEFSFAQIIAAALQIAAYGVVFAVIYRVTRSLWAPLTAHWLNNLILSVIVRN